jgi:hypothetical protein
MPKVRLVNSSRAKSRPSRRNARKRKMPSGLKRYWAKMRSALAQKNAGGGHMAKRKKRRSAKRRASRRRVSHRSSNPRTLFLAAPRRKSRKRRSSGRRRSYRRGRNPGLSSFTSGGMLQTVGGAAIGFFGSNALPSLIPQLAQYNTGITGYGLQAATGLAMSWGLKRFLGHGWGTGALIGTGLSLLLRIVKDHAASTGSTTSAAMSGDLAYYVDDRFPYPQGAGGPYGMFPGNPSLSNPPFPATSAAAVRAGAAAAAAALPAPAMHGIATGRWGVSSAGDASRWN